MKTLNTWSEENNTASGLDETMQKEIMDMGFYLQDGGYQQEQNSNGLFIRERIELDEKFLTVTVSATDNNDYETEIMQYDISEFYAKRDEVNEIVLSINDSY